MPAGVLVLQERPQHRRHEVAHGHTVPVEKVVQVSRIAVPSRLGQHHPRPVQQRPHQLGNRVVETDRRLHHQDVAGVQPEPVPERVQPVHQPAVGVGGTLRFSGRAGREQHVRRVARTDRRPGWGGGLGSDLLADRRVVQAHRTGVRRHHRPQRPGSQHDHRTRLGDHSRQPLRGTVRIEGHVHAPGLPDAPQPHHEVVPALQADAHRSAAHHALAAQPPGQLVRPNLHVPERQPLAAVLDHGDPVAPPAHGRLEPAHRRVEPGPQWTAVAQRDGAGQRGTGHDRQS